MQENHGRPVGGAGLRVSDIEEAGFDLLHDQRSDLNAARSSLVKSSGSCQAAKWLPRSTSLK